MMFLKFVNFRNINYVLFTMFTTIFVPIPCITIMEIGCCNLDVSYDKEVLNGTQTEVVSPNFPSQNKHKNLILTFEISPNSTSFHMHDFVLFLIFFKYLFFYWASFFTKMFVQISQYTQRTFLLSVSIPGGGGAPWFEEMWCKWALWLKKYRRGY